LNASFCCAKTSLLRGTTAVHGGYEKNGLMRLSVALRATALKLFLAGAFLLCEILLKISHIFLEKG